MKLFGRKRKSSRGLPNYWNESVIERIQRDAGVDRETAWVIPAAAAGGVAATEGVAAAEGGHDVGPAVQDTGPGDGGGGGFFSDLFGGDSGAGGSGDSGGGSGDSGGGGSSCGGGGCGGGRG